MESMLLNIGYIGLDARQLTAESCCRTSVSYSFRYVWYICVDNEYRESNWKGFLDKCLMKSI